MTDKTPAMPELPERLTLSKRLAICEAAQVLMDADCNRVIQATLDYIRSNYALAALQSAQPAAAPLPPASPATKGYCNDERCCQNCFSGQGACLFPLPKQAAAEVSDEQIMEAAAPWAWANLNCSEHYIDFARAILALRPQAVPMKAADVKALQEKLDQDGWPVNTVALAKIIKYTEAFHRIGITQRADGGEG